MASKVADAAARETRPSPEQLDAWARELAAAYPAMPAEQKRDLADMPVTWAALRLGWDGLAADQRAALVAQWAQVPMVKEAVAQVGRANAAAEGRRIAEIYRHHESHRRLINMGAYNLPRTPYRF